MHWNLYKDSKPTYGERCVVAYINQGKPMLGVFTYHLVGSTSYWKNDSVLMVYCRDNHKWCYIDDIVDAVELRLESELMDEIQRGRV